MTSTATATFELDKWEPQAQDETGGTEFARVAIAKTFTGAVEGTSTVEMLTASNATSRAYVAFEAWRCPSTGARVRSCCGTRRATRACRC